MSSPQPATFFLLARELRDLIYFQLLHSVAHRPLPVGHSNSNSKSNSNIQISATDIPIARLLRINRKFKQEYQFASDQLSTLTIFNYEEGKGHSSQYKGQEGEEEQQPLAPPLLLVLPSSLTRIPHIAFSLLAPAPGPSSPFHHHHPTTTTASSALTSLERWTDSLLAQFELKRIKSVSIHVEISPCAFSVLDFEGALLWSGNWTSLIRLKRLTVWRGVDAEPGFGFTGRDGVGTRTGRRSLMLEWERERCRFGTRMKKTEFPGNMWLDTQL